MNMKYIVIIYLFFSLCTVSCNKLVDVQPTDRLSEGQLFINKEGYLKALNGIYVELNNEASYGQEMTAGTLDVLAQYYFLTNSLNTYFETTTFAYTQANPKARFDNIWRKSYELVANCNIIIEKCGDGPSATLPQPYYSLIKGEALALRAMLQFDMLRLFGPIYSDQSKNTPTIPYITDNTLAVSPLRSSENVMRMVIEDLTSAITLMADTDPIRTEGVRNFSNTTGSNDLHFRQYRLNYYAVKALLARAQLWQGNKTEALIQAESLLGEVQSPEKNTFPYVTAAAATDPLKPDRMFSTEVMFALYHTNRVGMYNRLFDVTLSNTTKLSFSNADANDARVTNLYPDGNDYRKRIWQVLFSGSVSALTNVKYADVVDGPGRYMIPLIRLSEVLLIAAECHPDRATGIAYINKVRTSRNCVNVTPTDDVTFKMALTSEYRREMIGEGQQFFFYKRTAQTSIPNHAGITGTKTMTLTNYTVPLPDSETSQRN